MRYCLLISTFFLSFAAHAVAPIVNAPSGASGYQTNGGTAGIGTSVPITYTILAGIAGDGTNCTVPSDLHQTCNTCENPTCATAPLCACNTNQVYNTGIVTIPLTLPSGITQGNAIATGSGTVIGSTSGLLQLVTVNNNGAYVDFRWSTICQLMGNADCSQVASGATAQVNIYIDQNHSGVYDSGDSDGVLVTFKMLKPATGYDVYGVTNSDGVGEFTPYPGDEQIYIVDLATTGGWPSLSYGGTVQKIRVYPSDVNMTESVPGHGLTPADLIVQSNGELANRSVDGLSNGTPYTFRIALVDEANNVVQFFPPAATQTCDTDNPPNPVTCSYAAKPDQTLGLLTKDINCFIATAAYGSSLEPKLQVFRDFRFEVLLRHDWGRAFVKAYYNYGPKAALFIYDKPVVRAVTRAFLWPLYLYAWMSLKIGFGLASMFTLLILTSLLALPWFGMRRYYRSL